MTQNLKRGGIWLANLNPSKGTGAGAGAGAGKTRLVLILQNQALLDIAHPSTLIVPLTTTLIEKAYPLRIRVKAKDKLKKDSDLLIDQIRAIDNNRLVHGPLTVLEKDMMKKINDAVGEVAGTLQ